ATYGNLGVLTIDQVGLNASGNVSGAIGRTGQKRNVVRPAYWNDLGLWAPDSDFVDLRTCLQRDVGKRHQHRKVDVLPNSITPNGHKLVYQEVDPCACNRGNAVCTRGRCEIIHG